jgi:hypothetical protein
MMHAIVCWDFLNHGATVPVDQGLLIFEDSWSHSDTPHSLGFLWTSDQPVAVKSTWQHTTLTRNEHPWPGVIRTRNPSKRAAAVPRLRSGEHWDRHSFSLTAWINEITFHSSDDLSLSTDRRRQMAVEEGLTRNHYCDWLICLLAEIKLRKIRKGFKPIRFDYHYKSQFG